MKEENKKRIPSKLEAFASLLFVIIGVTLGTKFGVEIGTVLILSAVFVILIGFRCGYNWQEMEDAITEKIIGVLSVIYILLGIGFLISTWMFSGTIPTAVYYLVQIVSPSLIIVLSFLVCLIVAIIIGTSWGTAGTVGVVMISLAQVLNVPMAVTAGAVIAGCHYGQVISPMSDMVALSSSIAKVSPIELVKRSLFVVIPSTVISIIMYTAIGLNSTTSLGTSDLISNLLIGIEEMFSVNPLVLLPLAFIIFSSLKKWPTAPSMFLSGFIAIIIGVIFNNFSITDGLTAGFSGFNSSMTFIDAENVMPQLQNLINRGGIQTMSYTIIILFCAMMFTGVLSKIGCLEVIVDSLFRKVNKPGSLAVGVIVSSLITAMTTLTAYLAVIVPSELFLDKYVKNGYHPINMVIAAQTMGAIIMVAFPWGDTALYMSQVTGVPTIEYIPYAFFCWGTAIIVILFAYLKIGFVKLSDDEKSKFLVKK